MVWGCIRHRRRSPPQTPLGAAGATPPHPPIWAILSRQNVIGEVAPQSGELFPLIVDGVDPGVFQCFLDESARAVPPKAGVRQLLILDNASWPKSSRLNWHHCEPKFLPGYWPDFNPIERLWLRLKADRSWDYIARIPDALMEPLCTVLKSFLAQPDKTASTGSIRK